MARRKKLKKKELKEDQLVTAALKLSTFVQERFTQVIAGVVVLAAAVAVVLFTAQARKNSSSAADHEFSIAMNRYQTGQTDEAGTAFANIADQYSGQRVGKMSLYFLGETRMAQTRFQEAIEAYDRYLEKTERESDFYEAAQIAKALCYEALGQFREAATVLEQLSQTMDSSDVRYHEVLFDAAMFYQEVGADGTALELFRKVSEEGTGALQARATVWVTMIE